MLGQDVERTRPELIRVQFAVADQIYVLYLGQMVATLDTKDTSSDDVVGYITGTKTSAGASA